MAIERREIVVIGAGPAGSVAARIAAEMGLCPLLVEKDNSPGDSNACGGMAAYAFRKKLRLSDEVVEREIRKTVLQIGDDRIEFGGDNPTYVSFQRTKFDSFLADQAVQAGTELLTSTRAIDVNPDSRRIALKNTATGSESEVEARIIIFADGPRTLAWEAFGIGYAPGGSARHAIFYELDGEYGTGDSMEIIIDLNARASGYFWIFPRRDHVQVGVGSPLGDSGPPLSERIAKFIEAKSELRGRKVLRKGGGLLPGEQARRLCADGALVVGDAAGLVNPVTGGGIAFALLSGAMAGRVAGASINSGRSDRGALRSYPRRFRLTPHFSWLVMMAHMRQRVERTAPEEKALAYARLLKRYFGFFHSLRPLVDILLG